MRRRPPRSPVFYLSGAIGVAFAGLLALPYFGDILNGAARSVIRGGCQVVSVIDGDTVTLLCPGQLPERARLTGFDAPELFSPRCPSELALAYRAKWALRLATWRADRLEVVRKGRDRYDRALVAMAVDGVPVAGILIGQGLARPYDGGRREGWCV